MIVSSQYVLFTLDDQRYALPLASVERTVRAVAITRLPKAPEIVLGVINVHGRVIPVFDLRRRFQLPERKLTLTDQMILARTAQRTVAVIADTVLGVAESPEAGLIATDSVLPDLAYVEGIMKLPDGLVLIHDLDRFLSLDEEQGLTEALKKP
jgi:purine-binding chemotaxis protein CheW